MTTEERIRKINERIDQIGDKSSAEVKRLKNQRASFQQRLRIRSEEHERKLKIARREAQIKLVLLRTKESVAADVFQAISDDLKKRLPSLQQDGLL